LTGCDSRYKEEDVLSQYVIDLNRSRFISIAPPIIVMPNRFPAKRNRQQTLSQFDIGLLDFLSLQQCDVGFYAGKKNSILGKVMPESQRFLYELNIIRAIDSCEIVDQTLANTLDKVAKSKRSELSMAFGNAVFTGKESEAFFSLSNGFLPLSYSTNNHQALLISLSRLTKVGADLSKLPTINGKEFEADLKVLMDSEYAGRLLYSLSRATYYLDLVSKEIGILSRSSNSICGEPMTFLQQQFERHYVRVIQPYIGRINRSAYEILPLLNQLVSQSQPLTKDMAEFVEQFAFNKEGSVWIEYQRASQQHAKAWSALFSHCDVSFIS